VEEQVASIFLGTKGHLDSVPVGDVGRFESEFLDHLRHNHEGILTEIRETTKFSEDNEQRLVDAVNEFKKGFTAADGTSVVNEAPAEAMDESDEQRDSVKVSRPAPVKK
jgi:F-type H+-transporting ATPase subunit alpha